MKTQRGIIGLSVLIAVVLGLIVVGGGAYLVMHQSSVSQTPSYRDTTLPVERGTINSPTQKQDSTKSNHVSIPTNIPQAHTAFGINLFRSISQDERDSNIFISPSSIALALSMVYNGANGDTKTGMQNVLQFQNLNISTINQNSADLISALNDPNSGVVLSIANSVWANKAGSFRQDFLNTVQNYYSAQVSTLDFASPSAPATINGWASTHTNGKIPTIVDQIPPEMMMYLINAVYFKGSWTTAFDKAQTQDKTFTTADGIAEKRPFMSRHGYFPYLETADFQSIKLSYGKNARVSMYVFLPKNLSSFVASLNASDWNQWMTQYQSTNGTILLPRFKMEYAKTLNAVLQQLGMGTAFSDYADFGAVGTGPNGVPLKISQVLHKTYIDVNEEGTEAAAVTGIGTTEITAVRIEPMPFYMEVNRPFFFAIRDDQTGEVLFMGSMVNPAL